MQDMAELGHRNHAAPGIAARTPDSGNRIEAYFLLVHTTPSAPIIRLFAISRQTSPLHRIDRLMIPLPSSTHHPCL
jgi:hypothetical protein